MKALGKYSFGMGDRFGLEGDAQLKAILHANAKRINITPVWNKSHREHLTVNSKPEIVRKEAEIAIKNLNFKDPYFVDADHINFDIVDDYIPYCDFFTIDVAQFIGKAPYQKEKDAFLQFVQPYQGALYIPGIKNSITIDENELNEIINTFLFAAKKASEVYEHISLKKDDDFVVEVSMDEVAKPQSPIELFFILAALAYYKVPVSTLAPKFTGRFNKGIDYEGELRMFEKEFEEDLQVLKFAKKEFGLPDQLKLSIHSGSDKFSIYPVMNRLIKKHNAGIHVKTAGTTWLEEITVLAESSKEGFDFALKVYEKALDRYDELTSPYPDVLDIDKKALPSLENLKNDGKEKMAQALRHEPRGNRMNPHLRQLMHCAYKIAAEERGEFYNLMTLHRRAIEEKVMENLLEKHIKPIFF
ncbi:tagaturonate epimerase family protein [Echinicola jeungdonensis]|uniref:Tagaturonate/fructuronate epimerase n=1 Tax=Echinicola jeungdonensis TaxID=709343 RepID=A0ABV5J4Z6_9BACT|nr:tagaturonate epimerase family protein [Echinicola jeungdonensis]MDN3669531.1 tagaturonate epimerase family protein [Echinicola jeungdonensis]